MFQSAIGGIISCLGSAVGTGNIWRFPRILASHSHSTGALTFYIVWLLILFLWSIPIILVEYSIGRFTRNSVTLALCGWMVSVVFLLSAYYPVILGWCIYYLYISCSVASLPTTEQDGLEIFNNYTQHSYWPVFTQILAVALSGICLAGGIKWIEKANMILVPLLLSIVIFTFGWSLTRQYAEVGIVFLFTPAWSSFADPKLWIAAAGQNAFDTNAGMSVLATYSTFMARDSRIVSYSFLIPIVNNVVSFFASITIFSTVFSTIIQTNPTATRSAIWTVSYSSNYSFGREKCKHKSQKSLIERILLFDVNSFSLTIYYKDNTWGYGLIVSGFLFCLVVIIYGPNRYLRVLINDYGMNDCHLTVAWIPIIAVVKTGYR
ncbi:unnamed protein product [Heterobilharzia americana]|nr:unnamed protein product [Heterobilharzia americana]